MIVRNYTLERLLFIPLVFLQLKALKCCVHRLRMQKNSAREVDQLLD